LDFSGGLGVNVWDRKLGSTQNEDWLVGSMRLGVELGTPNPQGWILSVGLTYPPRVRENAHFDSAGFDQNPTLKPGQDVGA
jgi:hypothetical protein